MRTLALAASIFVSASSLYAQPRGGPSAQPAEPVETTEVRGRVVSAQTRVTVKGAKVAITTDARKTVSAFVRFDGSFVIENAPVGDHSIGVGAAGYELLRTRVRVSAGQPLEGLDLRINRSPIITGRILDENDRPVVGAKVEVLQEVFQNGRSQLVAQGARAARGTFRSDDRGIYRVFGLSAGEYFISVSPKTEPAPDGQLRMATSPRYFANAESLSDATPVALSWGEENQGIDIRLAPAPPTSAHGRVLTAEPGPFCRRCRIEIYRRDGKAVKQIGSRTTTEQGLFSLFGLPPGDYVAVTHIFDRTTSSQGFGRQPFTVSEGKVEAIVVEAFGENPVAGRLVLRDPPDTIGEKNGAWSTQVRLQPDSTDPTQARRSRGMFTQANGTGTEAPFELAVFPGQYGFMVGGLRGGYVERIEVGGRPVEGPKLTVPAGGIAGDVVVTISFKTGTVQGTVREAEDGESTGPASSLASTGGLLPPGVRVRLLPAEEGSIAGRWLGGRVKDGAFEVPAVPPGEYTAFAYPDAAGYSIEDPKYRKKLARFGKRVEVKAGDTSVLTLEALPRLSDSSDSGRGGFLQINR